MTRTARCHCGQVTITCEGDPDPVVMCSCQLCQRRTGAPFQIGAYFLAENVHIKGETETFHSIRDSGLDGPVNLCRNCGTSIWWEGFPGKIGVAGGCFADPEFPQPTVSVYERSKHRWVSIPDGIPRFEQMPSAEWLEAERPDVSRSS
jgi:hypothetical protein